MMLVYLVRREIRLGLDGDDDVPAWIRLGELLDWPDLLDLDLGLDLVLVFLSKNGRLMVISLELV
jgi:hypothetical protein